MNGIENEWKSKTVLIPSIGEKGFVEEATFLKGGEVVLFIKLENGKTIKMFASEVKKTEGAE
jgi:hypothetical protein